MSYSEITFKSGFKGRRPVSRFRTVLLGWWYANTKGHHILDKVGDRNDPYIQGNEISTE